MKVEPEAFSSPPTPFYDFGSISFATEADNSAHRALSIPLPSIPL